MTNYGVENTDPNAANQGQVTQVPPDQDAPAPDQAANVVAPAQPVGDGADVVVNAQPVDYLDTEEAQAQRDRAEASREAAAKQAAEDAAFHNENPDVPVARAANPEIGGERFV